MTRLVGLATFIGGKDNLVTEKALRCTDMKFREEPPRFFATIMQVRTLGQTTTATLDVRETVYAEGGSSHDIPAVFMRRLLDSIGLYPEKPLSEG